MLWDPEDMKCAFYVFRMAAAWYPSFAFNKPLTEQPVRWTPPNSFECDGNVMVAV